LIHYSKFRSFLGDLLGPGPGLGDHRFGDAANAKGRQL
jgi:hypothetical protein